MSDKRIVSVDEQVVKYQVKPSGEKKYKNRQLTGPQFVRSFCQHILPSGFQKIRYYGFMSPNCKLQLENVRWLVWLWKGWTYWLGRAMFQPKAIKPAGPTCRQCGGELELLAITNERGSIIWRRPLPDHLAIRGPP